MKRVGRIVADSGEAYERKPSMCSTLDSIIEQIQIGNFRIVDLTPKPEPEPLARHRARRGRKRPPPTPEAETMD